VHEVGKSKSRVGGYNAMNSNCATGFPAVHGPTPLIPTRRTAEFLHCPKEIWGRWAMDPFSFASSEALDIPLNIRMCVFQQSVLT
jgi:hypothetical protein